MSFFVLGCDDGFADDGFAGEGAVDGAAVGDVGEPFDLVGVEIAFKAEFGLDDVYFGVGGALALFAVAGVGFVVAEGDADGFDGPVFATGVEVDGHHFAGGEGAEKEIVGGGAGIVAAVVFGFVGDDWVVAGLDLDL